MTQMSRSGVVGLFMSMICLVALPYAAWAQTVAVADVTGIVTDQSGSAVPNAQVLMTETDKQAVHASVTDAFGRYVFPNLPVGPYRLEVKASGFKDHVQTGIVLQVASNITINVPLQVGSLTETVEVKANASMVESKDSAIAQVMEQMKIVALPLNGRNLTQLLTLTGGGTTAPGGD